MDGLEELLRAWGDALVCREEGIPRTSGGRAHALDRARDFAPGRNYLAAIIGRDGHDRRAFMAAKMGQARAVPMWAVDPVPCTASRHSPGRSHAPGLPDHLRPLADAIRALSRFDPLAAQALRQQYSGRGTQDDMAARLGVSKRAFRSALTRGRAVLRRAVGVPSIA
jgi:DNA-directed RNA polymerase specialized sigma24 family protein